MTRFNKSSLWLFIICIGLQILPGFSQNKKALLENEKNRILSNPKIEFVEFSEERATPAFIKLKGENSGALGKKAGLLLENLLNIRPGVDLMKEDKIQKLDESNEVLEFQQYFNGVKVDRSKFKAFVQNGFVKFYNGSFFNVPKNLSTKPTISESKALEFAKARIGAQTYVWEDYADKIKKTTEPQLKEALQKDLAELYPKGELVIIKDFSVLNSADVRLAYKFNIYATLPLSRSFVYIDANDGHVLLIDAIIKHLEDAPPPPTPSVLTQVTTRYAGKRNIYVSQVSGNDPNNGQTLQSSHPSTETYTPGNPTYVLIDNTRGNGVVTYDLNNVGGLPISVAPAYTAAKSFTDVDNNWTMPEHNRGGGNGGASEAENDDIAWDAHWGAEVVYDYWKNKHNRLSYDGNNAPIKSYIHSGAAYDNAFWNGSVMTYGDGSFPAPGGFKALTSLDVCGHEIGHGVCSSTSDLVYALESGAMNEALSDIWAACIEYYAIKNVDPSLAAKYKPFYIGEQISVDSTRPLRRMDSPKAESNPDTYGGQFWTKQPGCTPTLANDQCGVHNNSGVLNKWFYLITVGSGVGSGPDAAFAGTDDGVNDAVAGSHVANAYSVKGLGFNVAERITFLMETMLTATADFAEARLVSIQAATQISGSPCSAMVESVTNAWYAVGVGAKFVKPCTITYGFTISNGSLATTETGAPGGCSSYKIISLPVVMPANSSATISSGGTAINSVDYLLPSTTITNTASISKQIAFLVKIFDDAATEEDETISLNLTITNTLSNPVNTSFSITIMDDDAAPVLSVGQKNLLSETFTRADGFSDPAGWTETLELPETANGDPVATGKNQWGVFDNRLAITGKDGVTGTQFPNRNYNNASESKTIIKSPLIDAGGLANVNIKFDYLVQGEVDPAGTNPESFPAFDYMAVAYSFDGVKFTEFSIGALRQFASAQPDSGTVNVTLPSSFNNKKFYLAFRWNNDANAGGPISVSIDNLSVNALGLLIESDRGHFTHQNLNSLNDVYFKSVQDNQLLGRITNNTTTNIGCTYLVIERAGDAPYNLYKEANGANNKVVGKILRIMTDNKISSSKTMSLYYTEAQLAALETATGKNRTTFMVYRVDTTSYGFARSNNTTKYAATYSALTGIGGKYTFTFSPDLKGYYALGVLAPLGSKESSPNNELVKENGVKNGEWVDKIYPNPAKDYIQYSLKTSVDKKVKVEIVNVLGSIVETQNVNLFTGVNNLEFNIQKIPLGMYVIYLKNKNGEIISKGKFLKN